MRNNMRENNIAAANEEDTCLNSIFWAIALDPMGAGACYGGTAAIISCAAGGSSTTTAIAASSSCLGIPMLLCAGLLCYKAASGDSTEVRPAVATSFFINTGASIFRCGSRENADESVSLRTAPRQATGPYGSTSSTRSMSINR